MSKSMNQGSIQSIRQNRLLIMSLLGLLFLTISGCIVPSFGLVSMSERDEIKNTDRAFLSLGHTTREEVLLRLGEPDITLCNERILVYRWVRSKLTVVTTSAAKDFVRIHLLLLEFDELGQLKRIEEQTDANLLYGWGVGTAGVKSREMIKEWMPSDCPKPDWEQTKMVIIRPSYRLTTSTNCITAAVRPLRVKLGDFSDNREDLEGSKVGTMRTGSYRGFMKHEVHTPDKVVFVMRDAVKHQLESTGYLLVEDAEDIVVKGNIINFRIELIERNWTLSYPHRDEIKIDAVLEIKNKSGDTKSLSRRYQSMKKMEKHLYPFEEAAWYESAVGACIDDVLRQMCSDAELATFLRR